MSKDKLILFTTPTCGGCKVVHPIAEAKGIPFEYVDATEFPDRAAIHNVSSVPAFVLESEDGKHVSTVAVGAGESMKYIQEYERFI